MIQKWIEPKFSEKQYSFKKKFSQVIIVDEILNGRKWIEEDIWQMSDQRKL